MKVQLLNVTSAQVLWHSPPRRDLHGDLKGYKVSMVEIHTLSMVCVGQAVRDDVKVLGHYSGTVC